MPKTNLIICDAYNRCSAERIAGYKEEGYKVIILDEADFFDEEASLGKITYDAEITHNILETIEPRMHLANGFVVIVTTTRELNDVSIGEFTIFFKQVVMAIAADFVPDVSLKLDISFKNDKEHTYPQYRVICL